MTDVDPVGEKKQKFKRGVSRKSSVDSDEIDFGDKDERLRLKDAEAHAKREKELKKKEQRRLNALRRKEELEMAENARKEERRRNFEEKYENLPDGYNDRNGGVGWSSLVTEEQHNEMVERARKRREAKKNLKAEEYAQFEEKMRQEEEKRNREKERIKKEKLKRKEEMIAKKKAMAEANLSQEDREANDQDRKAKEEKTAKERLEGERLPETPRRSREKGKRKIRQGNGGGESEGKEEMERCLETGYERQPLI